VSVDIQVPELGESVVDATVGRWLKKEGESVTAGEPLVELETDKINFEVEAEQDGVLASILKDEGETVGIGETLGTLGEGGDGAQAEAEPAEEEAPAEEAEPAAEGGDGQEAGGRAAPSVRKFAEERGVDLAGISGSGPGGRITREDVEKVAGDGTREEAPAEEDGKREQPAREEKPAPQPQVAAREDGREERIRMSRRRQTIAKRLVQAQQEAAMLTTFNEVDMSAVMELRQRRKDAFQERHGVRLGFMSFFTKASIGALKAFPQVNAEIQGEELVVKHYYDIGVAVSTEEGLVVPVVRDADRKDFAALEREIYDLSVKARDRKLGLEDLQGGTFTITNGGVFGSLLSTPILNAPQVAILGMHKIEERPVVVDGEVVVRPMMYLALSYDHRIVDGREAVSFLVKIKELIEDPEALLLEG
jgi:2-oxoglutarate dehydrogenase E2 component (dihydrolipoamide succinyltransferase)